MTRVKAKELKLKCICTIKKQINGIVTLYLKFYLNFFQQSRRVTDTGYLLIILASVQLAKIPTGMQSLHLITTPTPHPQLSVHKIRIQRSSQAPDAPMLLDVFP